MSAENRNRRWWKAVLLNFGLTGLGHLYSGRPRAGLAIFLGLNIFILGLCLLALFGRSLSFLVLALGTGSILGIWIIIDAGLSAARAPQPYTLRSYNRWWLYLGLTLCGWLVWPKVVFTVVRHTLVEAFWMPSASMRPTIQVGDYFFVDRRPSAHRMPARDEVIVFESLSQPGVSVVKRAVGLPGDTLMTRDGTLYRNGQAVTEPWTIPLGPADTLPLIEGTDAMSRSLSDLAHHPTQANWGPVVVPPGSLYVLGDNRPNSYDSRFWGSLPATRIVGRPLYIYFNLTRGPDGLHTNWQRVGTNPWVVRPN